MYGTGGQAMRLIDADRLMDSLKGNVLIDVTPELEDTIAQQPTAFDKEKVIEQLNEAADWHGVYDGEYSIELNDAIEIVEKGGIE